MTDYRLRGLLTGGCIVYSDHPVRHFGARWATLGYHEWHPR